MHLWLVEDRARWGFSLNVVRAKNEDEAMRLVCPDYDNRYTGRKPEVKWLQPDGDAAIIWCHDESPDSPRD